MKKNKYPSSLFSEDNTDNTSGMKRNSSFIKYARSRADLVKQEQKYLQSEQFNKQKRTNIVAQIGSKTNTLESLEEMYKSGVDGFQLNLAYSSMDELVQLKNNRNILEEKYGYQIPITAVLQGNIVRIGELESPIIYLRKDDEYRIIIGKTVMGDQHICSIADIKFCKNLKIGDSIMIDYGQVQFTIKRFENSDKSLNYLKEFFEYEDDFKKTSGTKKKLMINKYQNQHTSSHETIAKFLFDQENTSKNIKKPKLMQTKTSSACELRIDEPTHNIFSQKLKNSSKNKKYHKVLVCKVNNDCQLKSYKPCFIYKEGKNTSFVPVDNSYSYDSQEECDFLTPKDIIEINSLQKNGILSICLTNVSKTQDIIDAKEILGENLAKNMKFIVKIQTVEGKLYQNDILLAVSNINEIIKESDGIVIARGYLTVHIPVEKLQFIVKDIIHKCHQNMKVVTVQGNILESMISGVLPNYSEIGEISNLINDYVDGIILTGETSYGIHPLDSIRTLRRIIIENELIQINKNADNPLKRNPFHLDTRDSPNKILNTIVHAALETSYKLPASLIISFTTTGELVKKFSKLRPPCRIVGITSNIVLARLLNYYRGVCGFYVSSMSGIKEILNKIIEKLKSENVIKKGQFVIVTSSPMEFQGETNQMRIIEVE